MSNDMRDSFERSSALLDHVRANGEALARALDALKDRTIEGKGLEVNGPCWCGDYSYALEGGDHDDTCHAARKALAAWRAG